MGDAAVQLAATKPAGPACSPAQQAYFDRLLRDARRAYAVAKKARASGKDPSLDVEIPPAEDLAARVEAQVGPAGVAQRIREATLRLGNREVVSLEVAGEVARDLLERGERKEKVLDQSVRTGLSILTEGILVAPLEGIAEVRIGVNMDGSDYVDLYFAGPIRAAGGTGQAMSVLIADVVRRSLGIDTYKPTPGEVERYKEEIPAYKQKANLQYTPTAAEIELIAQNCPVCINGEGTERVEVTGNRDLPRVETNQLRGGACLVMAEGLVLKAPKLLKHVDNLGLEGWSFLEAFTKKDKDDGGSAGTGIPDIPPNPKYMRDILAGRPALAHPSRPGGFRLRYGRSRTAGLAATSVHPATMHLVDDFLAVGTQMKVERPGKGTLATPCDTLDGPTVLLRSGDVVRLTDVAHVKQVRPAVAEILDLGEILVPFGEFAENNALLPQSSWVHEWWAQEAAGQGFPSHRPETPEAMVEHAETTGVPLHPDATLLWHDVDATAMRSLSDSVHSHGAWDGTLWLPTEGPVKATLEALLCLHTVREGRLRVDERYALALVRCLGLDVVDGSIIDTPRRRILHDPCQPDFQTRFPTVELASRLAGLPLMPRAPCRIGARVGRPEKADVRKMKPPATGLFPIGGAGGAQRLVADAAQQGTVEVEVGERICARCNRKNWRTWCDCGGHTEPDEKRPEPAKGQAEATSLDLRSEATRALSVVGMNRLPAKVKGVQGLVSRDKVPEPLEKAILRAKHGVWVFKDGTVRYDMIDVPLTHFRPREVGASVERLVKLGYTHDTEGRPLERDDQLLELRVQDIVVSTSCADYLLATTRFLDELLERFYGLEPFYRCERREDLVGQLGIGLAPHTSGGVLCRIIGFSPVKAHFGHPYFHAAKRRNCLAPDTEVFVLNSPEPRRATLESLFASCPEAAEPADGAGGLRKKVDGLHVLAVDQATGQVRPRRLQGLLRLPAPAALVQITTRSGRQVVASPQHRVLRAGPTLDRVRVHELKVGDDLAYARHVPIEEQPNMRLDLLDELERLDVQGLTLRGIRRWAQGRIAHLGGLGAAARRIGITSKTLHQYVARDSLPVAFARSLAGADGVPEECRVGRIRDRVTVPRFLPLDGDLAELVGWYLAEGCARTGNVHQVDIAASAQEAQDRIATLWHSRFAVHPSRDDHRVTVSGLLVHTVFTSVLGLGPTARTKAVPQRLAALPRESMRRLLSAYFAGDGSVEAGRLHVAATSVSRGLLRDLQLQLARFDIACTVRTERRPGGGRVAEHARRTGRPNPERTSHILHIRSQDAVRFADRIGFALSAKQAALETTVPKARAPRRTEFGDLVLDPVTKIEAVPAPGPFLYEVEVEEDHNFLCNDLLLTSNCDGDEDAVMLLMDGLLNFSRKYIPDQRGGLMDLPLVLSTRIDPNEIDKEAHNVDTLAQYPLAFYQATTRHASHKDVSSMMGLVESRLGRPEQYEGFGFTHDTSAIAQGPPASAYATLESTKAKLTAQMELARKIRAVDEPDVGARVIGTHLLPDIMGNLKAFSKQKVRCTKCNRKYRRMPLKGSCLTCGNPNLILTVSEGAVRKYLELSKEIGDKYHIDAYTRQRIVLLEQAVESLFNNDRVRKAKLSDFFGP